MIRKIFPVLFLLMLLFACSGGENSVDNLDEIKSKIDSVLISDTYSQSHQNDHLENLLQKISNDSVKITSTFSISYHFYQVNDSSSFRFWHKKSKTIAVEAKDTSWIAESYWDLANFFYKQNIIDSSFANYKKAHNLYSHVDNDVPAGRMLYNIAKIQSNIGDYTGSEITAVEAIQLLLNSNEFESLYYLYNLLAELKEYEKALDHYEIALMYLEKTERSEYHRAIILNNTGMVYQRMRDYTNSIQNFDKALSIENLLLDNPRIYAMLLSNKAYTLFQIKDTTGIHEMFNRSLAIRDSIGHLDGITLNKIYLSEYSLFKKDTARAVELALEANSLAHKTSNYPHVLDSYLLLSKIDPKNTEHYLRRHISLQDSLQQQERMLRNKFTKIRFETDQFIAENETLLERQNSFCN